MKKVYLGLSMIVVLEWNAIVQERNEKITRDYHGISSFITPRYGLTVILDKRI